MATASSSKARASCWTLPRPPIPEAAPRVCPSTGSRAWTAPAPRFSRTGPPRHRSGSGTPPTATSIRWKRGAAPISPAPRLLSVPRRGRPERMPHLAAGPGQFPAATAPTLLFDSATKTIQVPNFLLTGPGTPPHLSLPKFVYGQRLVRTAALSVGNGTVDGGLTGTCTARCQLHHQRAVPGPSPDRATHAAPIRATWAPSSTPATRPRPPTCSMTMEIRQWAPSTTTGPTSTLRRLGLPRCTLRTIRPGGPTTEARHEDLRHQLRPVSSTGGRYNSSGAFGPRFFCALGGLSMQLRPRNRASPGEAASPWRGHWIPARVCRGEMTWPARGGNPSRRLATARRGQCRPAAGSWTSPHDCRRWGGNPGKSWWNGRRPVERYAA